MQSLYCKVCCSGITAEVGDPCKTPNCTGTMQPWPVKTDYEHELPEPMTCPRRVENPPGPLGYGPEGEDRWWQFHTGPTQDRTCSYCGSLHPDDMFRLVKASAEAPRDADYRSVVEIEPSDKGYKVYVHQPGVRNAGEGGIKFYMQHLPRNSDGSIKVTDEQNAEYAEAVRRSNVRFGTMLKNRWSA